MATDYKKQYRPDQLEPFFPHEINKMIVVVLCTLAVIMFFVILPTLLERLGIHGIQHHEEPADPHGATPAGIKPEWYFLGTYQYLRLMPTTFLGISGKVWGVLSQGGIVTVVILLPFWYRKRAQERPSNLFRIGCTAVVMLFVTLTLWGGWPEVIVNGDEELAPFSQYFAHSPMMIVMAPLILLVFYMLIWHERAGIRRIMDSPPPSPPPSSQPNATGGAGPQSAGHSEAHP